MTSYSRRCHDCERPVMTSLTINQVHKYQKKDRHGHSSITKYRNVNFISGLDWGRPVMTSLTINQVHKYQKKDRPGPSSITKYRNVNFISGHQTCHLIGDVLSKCSHKAKSHDDPENEWCCSIIKCGNTSKHRSILFGDQAFQLIKDILSKCSYT